MINFRNDQNTRAYVHACMVCSKKIDYWNFFIFFHCLWSCFSYIKYL